MTEDLRKTRVNLAEGLDYRYRDFFNLFVGEFDLLLELGNQHRSTPGTLTVTERIMLPLGTAMALQESLTRVLAEHPALRAKSRRAEGKANSPL